MEAVEPLIRSNFHQATFTEYWQLGGCYVEPKWQRRGAGKLALAWGLIQARAERVQVMMKASPKRVELCERAGFTKWKRERFEEFFSTGQNGYWQMGWEPEE